MKLCKKIIIANLVTLSACDGALGKYSNGEGVLNFAWAFKYAGAENIVISRWKAPDKATLKIMELFYKHLKKHKNVSKALHQAKLQYLDESDAIGVSPYYWANFMAYTTKDFNNNWHRNIILILFLLLIVRFLYKLIK